MWFRLVYLGCWPFEHTAHIPTFFPTTRNSTVDSQRRPTLQTWDAKPHCSLAITENRSPSRQTPPSLRASRVPGASHQSPPNLHHTWTQATAQVPTNWALLSRSCEARGDDLDSLDSINPWTQTVLKLRSRAAPSNHHGDLPRERIQLGPPGQCCRCAYPARPQEPARTFAEHAVFAASGLLRLTELRNGAPMRARWTQ